MQSIDNTKTLVLKAGIHNDKEQHASKCFKTLCYEANLMFFQFSINCSKWCVGYNNEYGTVSPSSSTLGEYFVVRE